VIKLGNVDNDQLSVLVLGVSLYKILFHCEYFCGSQSSFYCPSPPAKPTLLQYDCRTCAIYDPLPRPPVPVCMTHSIPYW